MVIAFFVEVSVLLLFFDCFGVFWCFLVYYPEKKDEEGKIVEYEGQFFWEHMTWGKVLRYY